MIFCSVIGMPKEKYDPPDPRRMYTIMSSEEAANGKKSYWAELEISGECFQWVPSLVDFVYNVKSFFVYLPFMSHCWTQVNIGSSLIK